MSQEIIILDVSKFQGRIEWNKLAESNACRGVILKATEGNSIVDDEFARNYLEAKRVGLLRGVYHFAHPDRRDEDALVESIHFMSTVRKAGYVDEHFMFALDIEESRNVDKGPEFCEWVLTFCERVDELLNCRNVCGIYTGGPFWDEHDGAPSDEVRNRLSSRWLWLAAYVDDPIKYVSMTPWRYRGAALHQRSGDVGPGGRAGIRYPGITANVVDTNVFLGDSDLDVWLDSLWLDDAPLRFPNGDVPQAEDVVRQIAEKTDKSVT